MNEIGVIFAITYLYIMVAVLWVCIDENKIRCIFWPIFLFLFCVNKLPKLVYNFIAEQLPEIFEQLGNEIGKFTLDNDDE